MPPGIFVAAWTSNALALEIELDLKNSLETTFKSLILVLVSEAFLLSLFQVVVIVFNGSK